MSRFRLRGLPGPDRICWLYLAGVLAAAFFIWGLGDRWWLATALLFGPRWIVIVPLPVALVAAVRARWSGRLALAGAIVVAAFSVLGLRIGPDRWGAAPASGVRLRLVTFNVQGGGADPAGRLAGALALRPDILVMEECGPAMASAVARLTEWATRVDHSLCLVSRLPILQSWVRDPRDMWLRYGSAQIARYELETARGTIQLTAVHLASPREGLSEMVRRRFWAGAGAMRVVTDQRALEASLARGWSDQGKGPFLVAGDFNTPVESAIYRRYFGDLSNAFSRAGLGLGITKRTRLIGVRIDHVLMGPGWRALRAEVGPELGSDHRPMIADLVLTEPAAR